MRPTYFAVVRVFVFLGKIVSLTGPCAPYQANPWLFYPLLLAAIVDLASAGVLTRRSISLLALHVAIVLAFRQQGRLCEARTMQWHDP